MRNSCIRCGVCCKKGGPAFHLEDRHLIEQGFIHAKNLYTIREGELISDNVKGGIVSAESDIIKIRGKSDNSWACCFFDETGCTIYEHRPVECRALKCWDTHEIEALYSRDRLSRKDLLFKVKQLWEMIEDHNARCSYQKVISNQLSEIETISYDDHFRQLLAEKSVVKPDMTDFLFGRPMRITLARIRSYLDRKI